MNILRITIIILLLLWIFLVVGNTTITLKPFAIHVEYWIKAIGVILVLVGLEMTLIGEHQKAYKEGLEKGREMTIEVLQNKMEHEQI